MITMLLTHCNVNVRYFGATKNLPGVRELFEPVSHINRVCRQSIAIFLPGYSVYPEKVFYNLMEFPTIFYLPPHIPLFKINYAARKPQVKKKKKKRTRHEIYCGITPDYYGYRDDDDGVLAIVEAEAEKIGASARGDTHHHIRHACDKYTFWQTDFL